MSDLPPTVMLNLFQHPALRLPRTSKTEDWTPKQVRGDGENSIWTAEAEAELKKIPFFVRGKARRNTESFAAEQGRAAIDLETLYDAKAHYAR